MLLQASMTNVSAVLMVSAGETLFAAAAIVLITLLIARLTRFRVQIPSEEAPVVVTPVVTPTVMKVETPAAVEEEISEELVAVLTAAVAAMMAVPVSQIVIKNVREKQASASAWAVAGRNDQMNSRF